MLLKLLAVADQLHNQSFTVTRQLGEVLQRNRRPRRHRRHVMIDVEAHLNQATEQFAREFRVLDVVFAWSTTQVLSPTNSYFVRFTIKCLSAFSSLDLQPIPAVQSRSLVVVLRLLQTLSPRPLRFFQE
jgi:hypothetical protein